MDIGLKFDMKCNTQKEWLFHTEWMHHMKSMQCILDRSLYFFILVCNNIVIYIICNIHWISLLYGCVHFISNCEKYIFLFGTEKIFWDGQYILSNDSEHSSSIASIWRWDDNGQDFCWKPGRDCGIAWCDLCLWGWSVVFGTQDSAHINQKKPSHQQTVDFGVQG